MFAFKIFNQLQNYCLFNRHYYQSTNIILGRNTLNPIQETVQVAKAANTDFQRSKKLCSMIFCIKNAFSLQRAEAELCMKIICSYLTDRNMILQNNHEEGEIQV